MKRYAGERLDDGSVRVIVCDDQPFGEMFARWTTLPPMAALTLALPSRLAPRGFDWGLEGDGGVDLSRAILADCLGADQVEQLYQDFEWSVIRGLPYDAWELDEEIIRGVAEIQPILRDARISATTSAA